jgi:prepilin-type N-terminal cleavage/methylation domain-containing protein
VLTIMRNHRGFTLIELMIVLIIMLTVTAGIYKLLTGTQRLSRAQAERVDLQSNVRTAALVVPSELRELNTLVGGGATQIDILTSQPTVLRYRAMRGMGFVCQTSATQVRFSQLTYSGTRAPQGPPRDAAYVFVQGTSSATDVWLPVAYTALSTANTCPNGDAAYTLTFPAITAPVSGTPVRIYEVMELSLYVAADGKSYLGAQSISGGELSAQPILGPLRAGNGLNFKYYDGTGAETAVAGNIKSVRLTVRGETTQRISTGGGTTASNAYLGDSLVTQVSLRNSFRP